MSMFHTLYALNDLMSCHPDFEHLGVKTSCGGQTYVHWRSMTRWEDVIFWDDNTINHLTLKDRPGKQPYFTVHQLAERLLGSASVEALARQDSAELAALVGF